MIHSASSSKRTAIPYVYEASPKPPLWERASKTALLALSALGEGAVSSVKDGRQITVTSLPDGLAQVKMNQLKINKPAAPAPHRVRFEDAIVDPFPSHSEKDIKTVGELLKLLDDTHVLGLTLVMFRLADIGDEIAHLHPFTFMKIVFNDPILKQRMYRIVNSPLKRLGLMNGNGIREGFRHQFERENKNNSLEPNIDAFAASVNVPPEEIRKRVKEQRWTDLYYYLTQKT